MKLSPPKINIELTFFLPVNTGSKRQMKTMMTQRLQREIKTSKYLSIDVKILNV